MTAMVSVSLSCGTVVPPSKSGDGLRIVSSDDARNQAIAEVEF